MRAAAAGARVPLKTNADEALKSCPAVKHVIVAKHRRRRPMQAGRDHGYDDALRRRSAADLPAASR